MDTNEVAQTLEAAADLYESGEVNWAQFVLHDVDTHEACLLGVLGLVTGEDFNQVVVYGEESINYYQTQPGLKPSRAFFDARKALSDHMRPLFPLPHHNYEADVIYEANDQKIADQAQAVELLKGAAKDLRNQASP